MTDPGEPQISIERAPHGDCEVLSIAGEIDMATSDQFWRAIVDSRPGSDVIVDISHVSFIDSTGARALVHASKQRLDRGVGVRIVSPPGEKRIRRTIDLLQLQQLIPLHDDLLAAVDASNC